MEMIWSDMHKFLVILPSPAATNREEGELEIKTGSQTVQRLTPSCRREGPPLPTSPLSSLPGILLHAYYLVLPTRTSATAKPLNSAPRPHIPIPSMTGSLYYARHQKNSFMGPCAARPTRVSQCTPPPGGHQGVLRPTSVGRHQVIPAGPRTWGRVE